MFRNFNSKSKIRRQINHIFLISVIVPVLTLGTFSAFYIRNLMLGHYTRQLNADGVRVNSILFELTTSIYSSIESIYKNTGYMLLLGSDFSTEKQHENYTSLYNHIDYLQKNVASISFIHIYTNNPDIKTSPLISYIENYSGQDWYKNIPNGSFEAWERSTRTNNYGQEMTELCFVKKLGVVSDKYSAYMVLCLDNNYLKNRIEQSNYKITASVNNKNLFYSSDVHDTSTTIPENNKKELTNVLSFKSYKTNNVFYIGITDCSAYPAINRFTIVYTGIILFLTIVPSIIIISFSAFFGNRTNTLKCAMHQASLGDYDIIDNFKGDDELSDTFNYLKTTVETIKENTALYYETLINNQRLANKQQQMEYNMLASQINPHFLYNTLETIRVQALTENCMNVVSSINLLGKSMHYVLENTGNNTTTLESELDYIKTYLAIQKLRFGDRVNSVFEIEDSCPLDSIYILPLLLQPIVENAIIHGLENIYGKGYITISIKNNKDILFISIKDNGNGMDSETLHKVRCKLESDEQENTKSIGLFNINQRIKLYYGNEYCLSIDSVAGGGTEVTMLLPYSLIYRGE